MTTMPSIPAVERRPPAALADRRRNPRGSSPQAGGRRRRLVGGRLTVVLAAAAYAAYAIVLTWPLARDPAGMLAGPRQFQDLSGSVASFGYVLAHHVNPFLPATLHLLNAPEGVRQAWITNWAGLPSNLIIWSLSAVFGAFAGAAVFLWLGFVTSGVSMFLLTRRLCGSAPAAFLAGLAFAFCPFAVAQIAAHDVYMDGFVLVLVVWRMLELSTAPTGRNGLLAGTAAALAMWWTPYFILIGGVAFAVMAGVVVAVGCIGGEGRRSLRTVLIACLPIGALLLGLSALAHFAGGTTVGAIRTQDIEQLYTYSAHAAQWLLPDRHNLLFGGLTGGYLSSHLDGSNFGESSLYLGISVIALAGGGAWMAARRARARPRQVAVRDIRLIAPIAGVVLAIAAALFSLPPLLDVLGLRIAMPSGFVYEFTSTWRVYARFAELIELGLCIPLAFAAARLLSRRTALASGAVLIALTALLVVDLWARPPVAASSAAPPAEYVWLNHHPGGTVADYPLRPAAFPYYAPLVWQLDDGHPLLQGYASGSESETLKLGLVDLREPATAPTLAALGVRYVVVHPGQPGGSPAAMRRQGYVLRFSARTGTVWQVGAAAARNRVDALDGVSGVFGQPGAEYRWLGSDGVLGVFARGCISCRATVVLRSRADQVARRLTVTDQRTGRVLARALIPAQRTVTVRIPGVQLRGGQSRLALTASGSPGEVRRGVAGTVTVQEPRLIRAR